MVGKEESYQQLCESVMDRVDNESAWSDVTERDHKFKKMGGH